MRRRVSTGESSDGCKLQLMSHPQSVDKRPVQRIGGSIQGVHRKSQRLSVPCGCLSNSAGSTFRTSAKRPRILRLT